MPDTVIRERPTLASLAWVIARDANWTIGGGTATIEMLRRGFMRRGWMTDEDHQQVFAASRITPGTNLLAYCTAAGWHARGLSGAIVALLASSVPCSILAAVAMVVYMRLAASPTFAIALVMGMTVALVLLLLGAWHLARPHLTEANAARAMTIIALVLVLAWLDVSPIWVLLSASALGALWPASPVEPVSPRT